MLLFSLTLDSSYRHSPWAGSFAHGGAVETAVSEIQEAASVEEAMAQMLMCSQLCFARPGDRLLQHSSAVCTCGASQFVYLLKKIRLAPSLLASVIKIWWKTTAKNEA